MPLSQVEHYVNVVIPNIESQLSSDMPPHEKLELYNLYVEVLKMVAPYNFIAYNKYLELDEDHSSPNKAFYHHRQEHLKDVFVAFNDMEIYDKYDLLLICLPPRTGKTTTGIRFLFFFCGRYPENTELATSYSDSITQSFYTGVMEIVEGERFQEVFNEASLVNQNAKREEIPLF